MNFDSLLSFIFRLVVVIFAVLWILRWILFIPYIWFKYDKPIKKLKDELYRYREQERQRPISMPLIERRIVQKERYIAEKLDILQSQREHFLDRINLFFTIKKD